MAEFTLTPEMIEEYRTSPSCPRCKLGFISAFVSDGGDGEQHFQADDSGGGFRTMGCDVCGMVWAETWQVVSIRIVNNPHEEE